MRRTLVPRAGVSPARRARGLSPEAHMPDSRSKPAVVARLEQERQLLEETIGSIGPGAMLESGVVGQSSATAA